MGRVGRRPGESGSREAIIEAARQAFATRGYERATTRYIAGLAKVDPALIHHYFGTKDELFVATMQLPLDPGEMLMSLLRGQGESVGEAIVRVFLENLESRRQSQVLQGLIRSALSNEKAADLVRQFITREALAPVVSVLNRPQAELRASLIWSQLLGLAAARYLTPLEPLASMDVQTVSRVVGPSIDRFLSGDIPAGEPREGSPVEGTQGA